MKVESMIDEITSHSGMYSVAKKLKLTGSLTNSADFFWPVLKYLKLVGGVMM